MNGKAHAKVSLAIAGGLAAAALLTGEGTYLEHSVGALIGTIITPDLDVDRSFIGDVVIRNKFGKLAEKVWDGCWYAYRKSVKHGSPLSHFPVISTLGRLAYIALFVLVIPYLALSIVFPYMDLNGELLWWWDRVVRHKAVIQGLIMTDSVHYFMDIVTTNNKLDFGIIRRIVWQKKQRA